MSKIYEFYIDVFAVRNVLLQLTVFLWLMCLMNKKITWYQLLSASLLETFLQLLCVMYSMRWILPIAIILQPVIFSRILFPGINKRRLFQSLLYYLTLVSVHVSILELSLRMNKEYLFFMEAGVALTVMFLLVWLRQGEEEKREIYPTMILAFGEKVEVDALLDTGNELRENTTGKMVCIVEKDCMEEILKHVSWEDYHFISFHSVGQEQGILAAIEADRITITKEEGTKNIYGAIIGIYTGKLSSEGKFQMILHKDCLKGRMGYGNNVEHLFAQIYENRGA